MKLSTAEYIRRGIIKKAFAAAGYDLSDSDVMIVEGIISLLKKSGYSNLFEKSSSALSDAEWWEVGSAWLDDAKINGYC